MSDTAKKILAGGLGGLLVSKLLEGDSSAAGALGGAGAALLSSKSKRKRDTDDYEDSMQSSDSGRVSKETGGLMGKVPEGIVRGSGE